MPPDPQQRSHRMVLVITLVERARAVVDTDPTAAQPLIQEALEVDPKPSAGQEPAHARLDSRRDEAVILCFKASPPVPATGELEKALPSPAVPGRLSLGPAPAAASRHPPQGDRRGPAQQDPASRPGGACSNSNRTRWRPASGPISRRWPSEPTRSPISIRTTPIFRRLWPTSRSTAPRAENIRDCSTAACGQLHGRNAAVPPQPADPAAELVASRGDLSGFGAVPRLWRSYEAG